MKLEYVLPYEVFSDEPLTAAIEPVQPFPLGVRVTNVGFGPAKNFKIDSAQPRIVENKQGLLIDFKLLGTVVGGKTIADTLLVPFGDIQPNGVGQASWIMSTSLSGRFVEFASTFTHAAELGGALTSLLQSVTTYTLLKDVLVDLAGRDGTPDFLVNASSPRETMQAILDAGGVPPAELILESDQPQPLPVVELPGRLEGALGGAAANLTFSFDQAVGANVWAHSSVPFPLGTGIKLVSVQRADGKALSLRNVWVSKHFRKLDLAVLYRLNLLDLTSAATSYTLNFDPRGVDLPPGAVGDLAAATGALGGELALSWTAPGEDGYVGAILGGRYLIQHEEDGGAPFSPNLAQINFTTSTSPGRAETYRTLGLVGNTTHFIHLWTQDTGGGVSGLSNGATAYALPNPPRDLVFTAVGTGSVSTAWQVGNNRLPIEYQVGADSNTAAPLAATSPFFDSFSRSFVFVGLSPNTTYLFYGTGRNPENLAASEAAILGIAVTLSVPPQARPFTGASSSAITAVWSSEDNPADTEYMAELSSSAARAPVLAESGWIARTSFTFTGLAPGTTFFGQVKSRNRAGVETSFTDLGAFRTLDEDSLPPRTAFLAGMPNFGTVPLFVTDRTTFSFQAVDDRIAVEDGLGMAAATFFSVDSDSFSVAFGTFSLLVEPGTHTVRFFSVDLAGNREVVQVRELAVDTAPPVTSLASSIGAFVDASTGAFYPGATAFGFEAVDPPSTAAASGVARTEFRVDAGTEAASFETFVSTFPLAEGARLIEFRSLDNLGNLETIQTATGYIDATFPLTTMTFVGPRFSSGSVQYAAGVTQYLPEALDPLSQGVASGVREILVAVDTATLSIIISTLPALPEGSHQFAFLSVDNVLNREPTKLLDVLVDTTPPVTLIAPDGTGFITSKTTITLESSDPVSAGVSAGMGRTLFGVDGSTLAAFAEGFHLAEGSRTVAYFSEDNVLNRELERRTTFFVDNTAPVTSLSFLDGHQAESLGRVFVSSGTRFALGALDPLSSGIASGVQETLLSVDGGSFAVYGATIGALGEGGHEARYRSFDRAGNLEELKLTTFTVDATPPVIAISSPAGGERFIAFLSTIAVRFQLTDENDPAPSFEAFLVQIEDRGSPRGSRPAMVRTTTGQLIDPLGLDDGLWRMEVSAADFVQNRASVSSGTFEIVHDVGPPRTSLAVGLPQAEAGGTVFVTRLTSFTLSSLDDLVSIGDGQGLGTLAQDLSVDGLARARFLNPAPGVGGVVASSFTLETDADGPRLLAFSAEDVAANRESLRFSTVAVDNTPPAASFRIAGSSFTDLLGRLIISTSSLVVVEATDPLAGGAASGVELVRFGLAGPPDQTVAASSAAFLIHEGSFTVRFDAQDRVGNMSALGSFGVLVDTTGPRLDDPRVSPAGQENFVSSLDFVAALNVDARVKTQDMVSGLAPGTITTRLSKDGGASFTAVGNLSLSGSTGTVEPQTLSVPGLGVVESQSPSLPRNLLEVTSTDLAGNKSSLTFGILVDTTLPSISILSPSSAALLNTRTPELVLAYADALSGIDPGSLVVEVDGMAIPAAGGPSEARFMTPALADGFHQVATRIADRAGNVSAQAFVGFTIDATPPALALTPGPGSFLNITSPTLRAVYGDYGSGLVPSSLALSLDGLPVEPVIARSGTVLDPPIFPWKTAPLAPGIADFDFGVDSWNDRIYLLGGQNAQTGEVSRGVYFNSFSSTGVLGSWTETTSMIEGLLRPAVTIFKGVIYVLGGAAVPFSPRSNVRFARINADGTLAAWQETTPLPAALFGLDGVVAIGCGPFIYVMGGAADGGSTPRADVYFSRINADGTLGAWSATTFLPEPRINARAVDWKGRVYVMGGNRLISGVHVPQASVYIGAVTPSGQILGWTLGADLPTPKAAGAALVKSGVIAYLGGEEDSSHAAGKGVFTARARPDGGLDPWVRGPDLPTGTGTPGAALSGGFIYIAGLNTATLARLAFGAGLNEKIQAATATFAASGLGEGAHATQASVLDAAGNLGAASSSFSLDFTAPVSTLAALGFSRFIGGKVNVAGTVPLSISAFDPVSGGVASGVKETLLKKDAGALELLAGTFSLADGTHTIAFQSRDNAGNLEGLKSALLRVDSAAPGTVADLFGHSPTTSSLALDWTGVGDDGSAGDIAFGEVLLQTSTQGLDFSTASASVVKDLRDQGPGQGLSVGVSGLAPGTTYFFALWTRDTAGNYSGASNILAAQTLALAGSADGVASLLSSRADMTVSTVATAQAPAQFAVATGQGLGLLTTGFYELSPSGVAFSTPAVLTFVLAPGGADLEQISIYRFNGVSWDSSPVTGQTIAQLPGGLIEIKGFLLSASLYGVFERVDILPPRSEFSAGSPKAVGGGVLPAGGAGASFVSQRSVLALSSVDDRFAVGDATGAGVAFQELKVDGAPRSRFDNPSPAPGRIMASTFTLADPDGLRVISFMAQDSLGNQEVAKSTTVALDGTAPATSLMVQGGRQFASSVPGGFYASSDTRFALPAEDPVVGEVASGLAFTRFQDNGGSFQNFVSSFALAEGSHLIGYRSQDNVENLETIQTATISIDATPPVSTRTIGLPLFTAEDLTSYLAPATTVALSAVDPAVQGAASGVGRIETSLDGGAFTSYLANLAFTEGRHALVYRAVDNVGNTESDQRFDFSVDGTPPVTTVHIGSPDFTALDAARYVSPRSSVTFTARDPVAAQVASGLSRIEVDVDGAGFSAYSSTLTFTQGRHTVRFRALDRVGNVEAAQTIFLRSDATPPVTVLKPSATFYTADGKDFAPAYFTYTLPAADPVVEDVASGVALTRFSLDNGPLQGLTSFFSLLEGVRLVGFQSRDNVENLETIQTATVSVDATAPNTELSIGAPKFDPGGGGLVFVSARTSFTLTAQDPEVQGVAAGVREVAFKQGAGSFGAYGAPFASALPQGLKTVEWFASDNVGNAEAAKSTTVALDATAPVTVLAVAGGRQAPGPDASSFFASSDTLFAFSGFDPLLGEGEAASGLAFTRFQDNGGSFQNFVSSFTLAEGSHLLGYQSQDNVENLETLKTATISVDATAPVTNLVVNGLQVPAGALVLISTDSISFAATDSDSGVRETRFALDGGPESVSTGSFALAAGTHTLAFRSQDNVGNSESSLTANLTVLEEDSLAPVLSLIPVSGSTVTTARPGIAAVYSDPGRGIDPASVRLFLDGVNVTAQAVVTGSSATFAPGTDLSQGYHESTATVADSAGNLATASARFFIDSVSPVTSLLIGGPRFGDAAVYVASTTAFGFQVSEPARTFYAVDAGSFTLFTASFTLALEGLRTIAFYSVDSAGNQEVARSSQTFVDAAAPVTSLLVNGRSVPIGVLVLISTDALSFAALDSGAGVRETRFALDGGLESVSTGSFTLAAGTHTVTFQSSDNVGNLEPVLTANLTVLEKDSLAPVLSLIPVDGSTLTTARPGIAAVYSDSGRGIDLGSVRLVLDGVDVTTQAVVTGSSATFAPGTDLSQGYHESAAAAADSAGNAATAAARFFIDSLAPATALLIGEPRFGDATVYVASTTAFGFQVTEPARTFYAVDSGSFTVFTASFTVALEGLRTISFQSRDNAENLETLKTATISVDATPPTASVALSSEIFVSTDAVHFIAPGSSVAFSAADPPGGGAAGSGVNRIEVSIDDGAFGVYSSSLSFAQGRHKLVFSAIDNVGNREGARTLDIEVFARSGPIAAAGPDLKVLTGETVSFFASGSTDEGGVIVDYLWIFGDGAPAVAGSSVTHVYQSSGVFTVVLAVTDSVAAVAVDTAVVTVQTPEQAIREIEDQLAAAGLAGGTLKEFIAKLENAVKSIAKGNVSAALGQLDSFINSVEAQRGKNLTQAEADYLVAEAGRIRSALGAPVAAANPQITSITPGSGPAGSGFEVAGSGFGPYGGSATQVKVGDQAAPLSTWTNTMIRGIIPDSLLNGTYPVAVVRTSSSAVISSNQVLFTVASGLGGAALRLEPGPRPAWHYEAALPFTVQEGGRAEAPIRAAVEVPPRALEKDAVMTIAKAAQGKEAENRRYARVRGALGLGGDAFEFGPEGTRFVVPVTIELPYWPAALPRGKAPPAIHYWDAPARSWSPLQTELDLPRHKARARTDHFSTYQLLVPGVYDEELADAALSFRGLRVFPNPAKGGASVTIRAQPGRADEVLFDVYNMFGKPVAPRGRVTNFTVQNDGSGPRYSYEYVWDTSHVQTGVYTVTVTARRAGARTIEKAARIAVLR